MKITAVFRSFFYILTPLFIKLQSLVVGQYEEKYMSHKILKHIYLSYFLLCFQIKTTCSSINIFYFALKYSK